MAFPAFKEDIGAMVLHTVCNGYQFIGAKGPVNDPAWIAANAEATEIVGKLTTMFTGVEPKTVLRIILQAAEVEFNKMPEKADAAVSPNGIREEIVLPSGATFIRSGEPTPATTEQPPVKKAGKRAKKGNTAVPAMPVEENAGVKNTAMAAGLNLSDISTVKTAVENCTAVVNDRTVEHTPGCAADEKPAPSPALAGL